MVMARRWTVEYPIGQKRQHFWLGLLLQNFVTLPSRDGVSAPFPWTASDIRTAQWLERGSDAAGLLKTTEHLLPTCLPLPLPILLWCPEAAREGAWLPWSHHAGESTRTAILRKAKAPQPSSSQLFEPYKGQCWINE